MNGSCPAFRCRCGRRNAAAAFTVLEMVVVVAVIGVLVALLLPAVQAAREHARAAHCRNNLTQIWLGARSYYSAFEVLPAGTIAQRTPIRYFADDLHHSWSIPVRIQMDGGQLFAEQWDASRSVYDPVNWPLAAESPAVFRCPSSISFVAGSSNYAAIHDGRVEPIDEKSRGVFVANRALRHRDIPDGLAQTVFFGEIRLDDQVGTYLSWLSGSQATLRSTGLPPVLGEVSRSTISPVSYRYGWFLDAGKQSYEEYVQWVSGDPDLNPDQLTPQQIRQIAEQASSPPPLPTGDSSTGGGQVDPADASTAEAGVGGEESDATDGPWERDGPWEDEDQDADGASGGGGYGVGWGGYRGGSADYPFPTIGPAAIRPLPLGSFHTGGVQVAMGDGRIVLVAASLDLIVFSQLGVRNDSLPLVNPLPPESP